MSGKRQTRPYRWLAKYYDQIFTTHQPWFRAARQSILGPLMPGVRSGCDLACGSGKTAVELARAGLRMTGVDLSPAMCALARRRARQAGVAVQVTQADMRDFRLAERVDVVLCEYDALNHIPETDDLARVLECVERSLNPGGYFYFDVNTKLAFERVWPGDHFIESAGVTLVMRGSYDRRSGKAACDMDWFVREGSLWRRRRERVEQVCWSDRVMRAALRSAGLRTAGAWDATAFFSGSPETVSGSRTFYLARKPG